MKRALIGAGGFASTIKACIGVLDMPCFVDNAYWVPNDQHIFPLSEFNPEEYKVLVTVGDSQDRASIVRRLPKETKFFTFIHSSVQILNEKNTIIGEGSFIAPSVIISTGVTIGKHCHLNLASIVSHGCVIEDFFTTAPQATVLGDCKIGNKVYIGTNAVIKQKLQICDNVVLGMNAGVVKDITEPGVYIGTPARKVKKA